jgi:hypothetical protein
MERMLYQARYWEEPIALPSFKPAKGVDHVLSKDIIDNALVIARMNFWGSRVPAQNRNQSPEQYLVDDVLVDVTDYNPRTHPRLVLVSRSTQRMGLLAADTLGLPFDVESIEPIRPIRPSFDKSK